MYLHNIILWYYIIHNNICIYSIRLGLGQNEKPDYVTVCGVVSFIKHDTEPWYTACTQPNCSKKVVEGYIIVYINIYYISIIIQLKIIIIYNRS